MPPSSRMTLSVIPFTVRSLGVHAVCLVVWSDVDDEAEAVWYPDTSEGCWVETVDGVLCCTGIEAVAIESLDRTRSRGYVVPKCQR